MVLLKSREQKVMVAEPGLCSEQVLDYLFLIGCWHLYFTGLWCVTGGYVLVSFQPSVKLGELLLCCPAQTLSNHSFITRMLLNQAIDSGVGCPLTVEVLPVPGAVPPAFGSAEIEQLSCVIFYISSLLVRKNLVQWCGCVCVLAQPCQPTKNFYWAPSWIAVFIWSINISFTWEKVQIIFNRWNGGKITCFVKSQVSIEVEEQCPVFWAGTLVYLLFKIPSLWVYGRSCVPCSVAVGAVYSASKPLGTEHREKRVPGSSHVAPTARTANLGTGWHLLLILLPVEVW